jgi:hypothetical protein
MASAKRSVWALMAGMLTVIILTTLLDIVLHLVRFYPAWDAPLNDMQSVVATLYRVVIGAAGAWLTASLAPTNPMKHVLWLGVLGTVLCAVGAVVTWNKGMGPHWYGIALAALAIPQSWIGGKIYLSKSGGK